MIIYVETSCITPEARRRKFIEDGANAEKMRRLSICDENMRRFTICAQNTRMDMHAPMQVMVSHMGISWNSYMQEVCTTFRDLSWDFDVGVVFSKKQCAHIQRMVGNVSILRKATVWDDYALQCVATAFGNTLKELTITSCDMSDMRFLKTFRSLEKLSISGCRKLVDYSALPMIQGTLQKLKINSCGNSKTRIGLTDLSMCHNLRDIKLSGVGVTEIYGLPSSLIKLVLLQEPIAIFPNMPESLQHFKIVQCDQLIELPDLQHCNDLNQVIIDEMDALTNLGMMPQSLKHFELTQCPRVTELPDLQHCSDLSYLEIDDDVP